MYPPQPSGAIPTSSLGSASVLRRWSKAVVSIMQRVIRALVFGRSKVRSNAELRPDWPTPQGDVSAVRLDGVDCARQARTRLDNLGEPESAEHSAFAQTCQSYGIPQMRAKPWCQRFELAFWAVFSGGASGCSPRRQTKRAASPSKRQPSLPSSLGRR
eukprot:8110242-Pyramimonas_sp.AAC.1